MTVDEVWAAAISEAQAPMRCIWECSRPELTLDQPAQPLAAPCGTGSTQLSLDLPAGSVTRFRVEGDGRFALRSCDGNDEPAISVSGGTGAGELLAPLVAGHYFIDAYVEPNGTPTLAATTNALPQLSAIDCAASSSVPDDVVALGNLSIFYPSSVGTQFTSLATGTDRVTQLTVSSEDPTAAFDLCTSCDAQSCAHGTAHSGLGAPNLPAGSILSVPPGPARTVTFNWF
jgi:hypothetical protein